VLSELGELSDERGWTMRVETERDGERMDNVHVEGDEVRG